MRPSAKQLWIVAAGVGLFALTVAAYWQARHFDFTDYDDQDYVARNPMVTGGLTPAGIRWALTTTYFSYWHPVTWMSHQADCQFFGLAAGRHHLVSLLLHGINGVLCLLVFGVLTGYWARSALVAALFALHPLHVESVAWIAERKDLTSGCFFFLTIGAYAAYARRGGSWRYGLALAAYLAGAASKPMLVTLPCLLLLLDYWPLRRLRLPAVLDATGIGPGATAVPWRRLLLEKIPFLVIAIACSAITYVGVKRAGTMLGGDALPWSLRLGNVPVSYVRYLGKMLFPDDLTFLYPYPERWEFWQVAGAAVILAVISLGAVAFLQRAPWFLVGWLWFLGMLVPTMNLNAVGLQSIADRYTYLPLLGLFLIATWLFAEASASWPRRTWIAGGVAALLVLAMAGGTRRQARVWQNSVTLFGHAVNVDSNNAVAHFNLGRALVERGRLAEPAFHFQKAIDLHARFKTFPDVYKAHANLAVIAAATGRWTEASNHVALAHRLRPHDPDVNLTFGRTLLALGKAAAAVPHLELAARGRTNFVEPRLFLAEALTKMGRPADAVAEYRASLKINADSSSALSGLAWLLATTRDDRVRNGVEALRLAARACQLSGTNQPAPVLSLAAGYGETGEPTRAIEMARVALKLATRPAGGDTNALKQAEALLRTLEQGRAPHAMEAW